MLISLRTMVWMSIAILCATTPASAQDKVFQESGGLLVMEAESSPLPAANWTASTTLAGFTGGAYYVYTGPTTNRALPQNGVITYRFNITNPGKYNLRIHAHSAGTLGWPDVFARFDSDGWLYVFSDTRLAKTWNWNTYYDTGTSHLRVVVTLGVGLHTMTFTGRVVDWAYDRIHIYKDGVANPESKNLPQSTFTVDGAVPDGGLDMRPPPPDMSRTADGSRQPGVDAPSSIKNDGSAPTADSGAEATADANDSGTKTASSGGCALARAADVRGGFGAGLSAAILAVLVFAIRTPLRRRHPW